MKFKNLTCALLCAMAVIVPAIVFLPGCKRHDAAPTVDEMALECLRHNVDRPDLIEVISISDPEEVYGHSRMTYDEKMDIAQRMMVLTNQIMQNPETFDLSDSRISDVVDRQMRLSTVLNTIEPADSTARQQPQTGWRVKVLYEGMSRNGNPYRSEFWAYFDRNKRFIFDSFEVPVL